MADDVSPGLGLGGEDSPWARDVPAPPAPPLPDSWTRTEPAAVATPDGRPPPLDPVRPELDGGTSIAPTEGFEGLETGDIVPVAPSGPRRSRPALVVVGIVGIVAALVVGSQLIGGDDGGDGGDDAEAVTGATTEDERELESESTIADASRTDRDSNTVAPPRSTERVRPRPPASLPEPEPVWVSTRVDISPRLQAMTVPTQVVVLNADATIHVIDVPTGVMHSIDTGVNGADLALVLGDDAIAVRSYNGGGITVLNVDGPVYDVDISGGAGEMLGRPGTNDFVVMPNNWSNNLPTNLLISADGTSTEIEEGPLREYGVWALRYVRATGEAVVDESAGTYAIDSAGTARRLSIGSLAAVGDNHVLVRECDETLTCVYVRVDAVTGERLEVQVPDLTRFGGFDPTLGLSPDGSMLTYFDWMASPLARRLVDMTDGTTAEVDSVDQYGNNAAWAADSSGMFIVDGRTLAFYDRTTGDRHEVAPGVDLGRIVGVTSRP